MATQDKHVKEHDAQVTEMSTRVGARYVLEFRTGVSEFNTYEHYGIVDAEYLINALHECGGDAVEIRATELRRDHTWHDATEYALDIWSSTVAHRVSVSDDTSAIPPIIQTRVERDLWMIRCCGSRLGPDADRLAIDHINAVSAARAIAAE